MDILVVLFWALIGSVFSLIGGIALIGAVKMRKTVTRYGLPFGAGALLATAFVSLIPEAVEGSDIHTAMYFAIGGFLAFFILERSIGWFHHHHHHDAHGKENKTHTTLVIVGDTLHNAIDGVALGAAFLVNPAAGIATALAIAAHEIPQEIGDFGILLGKGMKAKKVILVNLLSALATVVTALTVYVLGDASGIDPAPLLAVAAGLFIYIAASDIIPEIHEGPRREANVQALMLLVGVTVLATIAVLTPHDHAHEDTDTHSGDHHSHSEVESHSDEAHEDHHEDDHDHQY